MGHQMTFWNESMLKRMAERLERVEAMVAEILEAVGPEPDEPAPRVGAAGGVGRNECARRVLC